MFAELNQIPGNGNLVEYNAISKWNFVLKMHALKSLSTNSHLTFTCSKLTIKTLERGVKYDQS